jgi:hypothetical protein
VPVLLGVVFVVMLTVDLLPGDAVTLMLGEHATKDAVAALPNVLSEDWGGGGAADSAGRGQAIRRVTRGGRGTWDVHPDSRNGDDPDRMCPPRPARVKARRRPPPEVAPSPSTIRLFNTAPRPPWASAKPRGMRSRREARRQRVE